MAGPKSTQTYTEVLRTAEGPRSVQTYTEVLRTEPEPAPLLNPPPEPTTTTAPPLGLGCGEYTVYLQERGGRRLAQLPWERIDFGRRLDEVSDASVDIPVEGIADDDECCFWLSQVNPWEHEVSIYRDGAEEWVGPVIEPVFSRDTVTLAARDLFVWFEKRLLPLGRQFVAVDIGEIFQQYVEDVLALDDPGITVNAQRVGIVGDRTNDPTEFRRAADELRELARSGIDWTMVRRTMEVGGEEVPTESVADLIDDAFNALELRIGGGETATEVVVVGGQDPDFETTVFGRVGGIDPLLGLLQAAVNESSILDQHSAEAAAQTRLDLRESPPFFIDGELSQLAGVQFPDLVPGAAVDVDMDIGCRAVLGTLRLRAVNVTVEASEEGCQESVNVELMSQGTIDLGS